MPFKKPSKLLQKVMRLKALKHANGKFFLWDIPCFIDPIYMQVYYYKLMKDKVGEDEANRIRYFTGKLEAILGVSIINKRFGYATSMKEKLDLVEFNNEQTMLMGFGEAKVVRADFKNEHFIFQGKMTFGRDHLRFFDKERTLVDHWVAGMYAGGLEVITGNKNLVGIESKCVANGNSSCEFIIKPKNKWDKNDPLVKKNKFLFKEEKNWKQMAKQLSTKLGPFD